MEERKTIATTLIGGIGDGEVVAVASDEQAISLPRLGNGWAVYYKCPDGCYRFVDTSAKVIGREVEP